MTRRLLVLILSTSMLLAAALGAEAQRTNVTILAETRATYNQWYQALERLYEQENPNVNIEFVGQSGDRLQIMLAMIAAGMPLDIGWYDPWVVPQWARQGMLVDLTPYVNRDAEHFELWFPAVFDAYTVDGVIYGLPRDLQLPAIFYNVDWLDAAGLGTPSDQWTWFEFAEYARRLTRHTGGEITQWGFKMPSWRNWLNVIWNFGADYVDDWVTPTRFTGNTPEMVQALEYYRSLVESQAMPFGESDNTPAIATAFRNEQVAMGLTNTITMAQISNQTEFNWDIAAIPHGPGDYVTSLNAIGWFMFSTSPVKDLAWDVLKFYTSKTAQELLVQYVSTPGPRQDVVIDTWMTTVTKPANRIVFFDGVLYARPLGTLQDSIYAAFSGPTDEVIAGNLGISSAIELMQQQVEQAIADWNAGITQ